MNTAHPSAATLRRARAGLHFLLSGGSRLLIFLSITFLVGEILLRTEPLRYHVLYEYLLYLGRLLRFDLGTNRDGVQILFYLQPALRNSLRLFLVPMVVSLGLAYYIGSRTYIRRSGVIAGVVRRIANFASAVPVYWLALLFFVVAVETGWFPVGNVSSPGADRLPRVARSLNYLHHLALPWASLMLYPVMVLSERIQTRLRSVSSQNFVKALESRGYQRSTIVHRHLYPVVLSDLLHGFAALVPMLITYLVLVERVFNYPGLGLMTIGQFQGIAPVPDTSVSQAGLTYLGILAILIQTLARSLAGLILPEPTNDSGDARTAVWRRIALPAIGVSALLLPALAAAGPWQTMQAQDAGMMPVRLLLLLLSGTAFVFAVRRVRAASPAARLFRTASQQRLRLCIPVPDPAWVGRGIRTHGRQILTIALLAAAFALLLGAGFVIEAPPRSFANPIMAERATGIPWPVAYTQRAIVASRFMLIPLAAAVAAVVAGTLAGGIAGYHGLQSADRIADIIETFPSVTVLVMMSAATDRSIMGLLVTLALIGGARMYRRIRFEVEQIRGRDYIRYSTLLGSPAGTVMFRHILRNTAPLIAQAGVLVAVDLLILEANMSFLGNFYSLPFEWESFIPVRGWGLMLNETRSLMIRGDIAPALIPAAFLSAAVIIGRALAGAVRGRTQS
ncbi:MAG: ABC transporter permease subunit [Spirochaetaceae bacterium]|nr:MAG: ABC transporter permease subunit [Spirochaetaceae bacterium]